MIAKADRCDAEVPDGPDTPRGHRCRNVWRYEVMERNGETRTICAIHLRPLVRQRLVVLRSDNAMLEKQEG